MFTSHPFEESHKVSFRLTLIFIIFFPFFLKLFTHYCSEIMSANLWPLRSTDYTSSIIHNPCPPQPCDRHNIKQTGSQNLYSLGTTRINKYENHISEDGGQHYVKQIEDILGKSENGERVSWRFQLIFAAVAQPQLIRRQKRAIRALRGPLWQYTHNGIAALGPFSVMEFNLVSSHNVYYVCALNMIFSIWSDLSSPQLTLIFLSGSGLVRARPAGAKAPVIPWGHLLPRNGCHQPPRTP